MISGDDMQPYIDHQYRAGSVFPRHMIELVDDLCSCHGPGRARNHDCLDVISSTAARWPVPFLKDRIDDAATQDRHDTDVL